MPSLSRNDSKVSPSEECSCSLMIRPSSLRLSARPRLEAGAPFRGIAADGGAIVALGVLRHLAHQGAVAEHGLEGAVPSGPVVGIPVDEARLGVEQVDQVQA